jgi:hypothetical protein
MMQKPKDLKELHEHQEAEKEAVRDKEGLLLKEEPEAQKSLLAGQVILQKKQTVNIIAVVSKRHETN